MTGYNLAIGRDHVALSDEQLVSRDKCRDGNLGQAGCGDTNSATGGARQKFAHTALCAPLSKAFQKLPTCIHDSNDGAGKIFAKPERSTHGQGSDEIQADVAPSQTECDINRKRDDDSDRRADQSGGGPEKQIAMPPPQQTADDEACDCDSRERKRPNAVNNREGYWGAVIDTRRSTHARTKPAIPAKVATQPAIAKRIA
ncbi:hypothetical protein FHX10_003723 [Rhizobium sp. BK591]|nr:hypothetical protein [Rhizobium sp. BK591]